MGTITEQLFKAVVRPFFMQKKRVRQSKIGKPFRAFIQNVYEILKDIDQKIEHLIESIRHWRIQSRSPDTTLDRYMN